MGSVELMTPSMLERMRASCSLAADTLLHVGEHLRVGMTELMLRRSGALTILVAPVTP